MWNEEYAHSVGANDPPFKAEPGEKPEGLEHVDSQKIAAMQAYSKQLRKKFPHMKAKRLERKVAEHFKVKLI